MNRLVGVSLVENKSAHCTNCGMEKQNSHGCCKDECKQIKLQADERLTSNNYTFTGFGSPVIIQPYLAFGFTKKYSPLLDESISHAPPLLLKQRLYMQNGVWRI